MTKEMAILKKDEMPAVTRQMCDDFLFTAGTKLSEQQKVMFYNLALQFNLNPFKREIHAIPYGSSWNFVTGYQVYVARAEATGQLDGWATESIHDEKGNLQGAKIIIYRKDWEHPFVWEVALAEFEKQTTIWKTMKEFMIKKIAIGQGFRLAFPNELGGLPYLKEELEDLSPESNTPPIKAPEAKTEAGIKTIQTGIDNVLMKSGGTKEKPWTRYTVEAGQEKYSTFDKKIAEEAKKAKEGGLQVLIEYKSGEYGNEIISLNIIWPKEPGSSG